MTDAAKLRKLADFGERNKLYVKMLRSYYLSATLELMCTDLRRIADRLEALEASCEATRKWWIDGAYLPAEVSDAIEAAIAKAKEKR